MAGLVMWPSLSSMSRPAERVVSEDKSATPEQHNICVSNMSPADSNASNGTAEETDEVIQVQKEVERHTTTILVEGPD
jgi:hypothetical protein